MRSEADIRKRLRQVLYRHYQQLARETFRQLPENCTFSQATSLQFPDGRPFRVCGLMSSPESILDCNTNAQAQQCPSFVYARTKEELRKQIAAEASDGEVGPRVYKEAAVLLWVLDEEAQEPVSWWRAKYLGVKGWFRRVFSHRPYSGTNGHRVESGSTDEGQSST